MKKVKIKKIIIGDGAPKTCIPVVGTNSSEIIIHADTVLSSNPDIIEFRADMLGPVYNEQQILNTANSLKEKSDSIPILFTFRTESQGGFSPISNHDYTLLLKKIADENIADIVDVEFPHNPEEILPDFFPAICSFHMGKEFEINKLDVEKLIEISHRENTIIKLAAYINSEEELEELKSFSDMLEKSTNSPLVIIGMGDKGIHTRLNPKEYNSSLVFMKKDRGSAPGQIDISDIDKINF